MTLDISRCHAFPVDQIGMAPDPFDAYALGLAPCRPGQGGNRDDEPCTSTACGTEGCNCSPSPRRMLTADALKADLERAIEQLLAIIGSVTR